MTLALIHRESVDNAIQEMAGRAIIQRMLTRAGIRLCGMIEAQIQMARQALATPPGQGEPCLERLSMRESIRARYCRVNNRQAVSEMSIRAVAS